MPASTIKSVTRKKILADIRKAEALKEVSRRPPVRGYWGRSHHGKLEAGSVTMKERAVSWRRTLLEAMDAIGVDVVYRRRVELHWDFETYSWFAFSRTPDGGTLDIIAAFDSAHEPRLSLVRGHLDDKRARFV